MKGFSIRIPAASAAFIIALIGLAVSADLVWLHYKVHTDAGYQSFCALSDAFNCQTVAESGYSVFGGLPVAVWGMLGYAALIAVLLLNGIRRPLSAPALLFGTVFSASATIVSLVLALISYCIICAFCLLCTVTYAANASLLVLFGICAFKQRLDVRCALREMRALLAGRPRILVFAVVLLALLSLVYPKYWRHTLVSAKAVHSGRTAEGAFWLGANDEEPAPVVITEFSDYMCPHCKRGHASLRDLLNANAGRLRIVHRHFPLDEACNPIVRSAFHPGACLMARAAFCAGQQEKFWEMNDSLYRYESLEGAGIPEKIGNAAKGLRLDEARFEECMTSAAAEHALRDDIGQGIALNIRGTPAFVIDGEVYGGRIPDRVIREKNLLQPNATPR